LQVISIADPDNVLKIIWITTSAIQGHVMSSMTSSFDPPQAISH